MGTSDGYLDALLDHFTPRVAVDWIFSSRVKSVGLEPFFGTYQWWAGPGLFLTFWRSLGGSLGEHVFLKKKKNVSDQMRLEKK